MKLNEILAVLTIVAASTAMSACSDDNPTTPSSPASSASTGGMTGTGGSGAAGGASTSANGGSGGMAIACPSEDRKAADEILAEVADYSTWNDVEGNTPAIRKPFIASMHGKMLKLHANQAAQDTFANWVTDGHSSGGALSMPDGAIIVKENYNEAGDTLMAVTVMKKVSSFGSASTAPGWFWIKAKPDLTPVENCEAEPPVMVYGSPKGCTGCHNGETNWGVFPGPNSNPPDDPVTDPKGKDALEAFDYIVSAYCADPNQTDCNLDPIP